jgi:16S rRNA (cytidine1402-2'-O)-methyltransferase
VGKIILLNTPIGNLGDVTARVVEALRTGTVFAVEDTRVFKDLLGHLGVSVAGKRILSLHDQSGPGQVDRLLEVLESGDLYVASEAGSPIISDPAYPLVLGAYARGFAVESYSGVSSPVMALELSGLPPIPFQFHGFLSREAGKQQRFFRDVGYGTHIFFEAPTRVEETLGELCRARPGASVCVVREISKKFEQVVRFPASAWDEVRPTLTFRGELVVLFHNPETAAATAGNLRELAGEILENGANPKLVAKLLGQILDRPTKEIYGELNRQKKDG